MEKHCLHCKAAFTTNRVDKKYCKENCKQMAYLERNGLKRVGAANLNEIASVVKSCGSSQSNLYPQDFGRDISELLNEAKPNEVFDPVGKESVHFDEILLLKVLIKDLEDKLTTMEQKLEMALQEIRQEFYGKTQPRKLSGIFSKQITGENRLSLESLLKF